MVQGREFIRNAVLEHFGVPREIMGITERENVIHGNLPNQAARCSDLVEGMADIRGFLHPVRRERTLYMVV